MFCDMEILTEAGTDITSVALPDVFLWWPASMLFKCLDLKNIA